MAAHDASALAPEPAKAAPVSPPAMRTPIAKTGAVPPLASLPAASHVAGPPTTGIPKHVAAGARVEGLVTESLPEEQAKRMRYMRPGLKLTYLFADAAQAREFAKSQRNRGSRTETCLVDGGTAETLDPSRRGEDAAPPEWPSNNSSFLSFQFELAPALEPRVTVRGAKFSRSSPGSDVHAVHTERFVAGEGGSARIEITDAWFDMRTGGSRLIDRATLPLARVFEGPNGLDVYAARDGEALQIVFHAATPDGGDAALVEQIRDRTTSMSATLSDRGNGNSDCGHLRLVLHAPAGGGEMATLQSTAFLPPADGDWGTASDGETDDSRGARLFQAMRSRPFQLGVSATRASGDPAPVLSIGLGWIGRERAGG
jgi:hypothetical protein